VFPTQRGHRDTRQNVRTRLLVKAINKANEKLVPAGLADPEDLTPRAEAHLRVAALCVRRRSGVRRKQVGHTDPTFTLRVYAQAVRHRSKLTPAERDAFDRAVDRAYLGAAPAFGED
jgi:integrase